jgi:penicillin amidase
MVLVRPAPCRDDCAGIATFLALDRAQDAAGALRVLRHYEGAGENFVIADTRGRVAYHLAGSIPNDPSWGRYVHPATDLRRAYRAIAFDALPSRDVSRSGVVVTANNKMYGAGYRYRLAATFELPYRAYRIAQLLHGRNRYDAAYFAAMQLDTESPVELALARDVVASRALAATASAADLRALAAWSGKFSSDSRAATLVHQLRAGLESDVPSLPVLLGDLRSRRIDLAIDADLSGALFAGTRSTPWGAAGAVQVYHPLAPLNFAFLNGRTLPGEGDEYTIHLQEPGFSQSFRAVWDVGRWDDGGISIPSGESGAPGSPHYTDLTEDWIAGRLRALPFSAAAIARARRATLTLLP